jgi:hypothetical protein
MSGVLCAVQIFNAFYLVIDGGKKSKWEKAKIH